MAKVSIVVNKAAALKAGQDKYGVHVVDVPAETLTQEEREELALHHHCYNGPSADFFLHQEYHPPITAPTAEEVRTLLAALIANKKAKAAEEAERGRREDEERQRGIDAVLAKPAKEHIIREYGSWVVDWALRGSGLPQEDAAKQLAARLNAEAEAEEKARKEREAQAKADGVAKLRQWADANGSELLKARITEGYEWIKLAEREYADTVVAVLNEESAADTPDGYEADEDERTTPTLEEIEHLRAIRERLGDAAAEADLVWVKYTREADYEGGEDEDKFSRAEIRVDISAPNGSTKQYYYVAAKSEVAS